MSDTPNSNAKTPQLTLASVLSDLTSLGVCVGRASSHAPTRGAHRKQNTASALALVSARSGSNAQGTAMNANEETSDPDLKRAFTLTEVYSSVKREFAGDSVQASGQSARSDLEKARGDVARAMRVLGR